MPDHIVYDTLARHLRGQGNLGTAQPHHPVRHGRRLCQRPLLIVPTPAPSKLLNTIFNRKDGVWEHIPQHLRLNAVGSLGRRWVPDDSPSWGASAVGKLKSDHVVHQDAHGRAPVCIVYFVITLPDTALRMCTSVLVASVHILEFDNPLTVLS